MPTAVLIGGTGKIGKELTRELLERDEFTKVRSVVRRARDAEYYGLKALPEKLEQVEADFSKPLPAEHFAGFTHGFSCFGTTRRDAGSAEAFSKIDMGTNVDAAKLMKAGGVAHMQLVSSQGADAKSWLLYPSVKGKIEEAVKGMGFEKVTIWRPGLLAGRDAGSARRLESFANMVTPNCFRAHVKTVARAMCFNAMTPHDGACETFENKALKDFVVAKGGQEALTGGC